MSLLLLFADQQQQSAQPARRRKRTTVIVRRREQIRTPLEEWERERKGALTVLHDTQLSPDDLARALREDEEFLLLD